MLKLGKTIEIFLKIWSSAEIDYILKPSCCTNELYLCCGFEVAVIEYSLELIDNYNITDEVIEKFDAFTSNVTNILKILPSFGDYYELSMIYYLYSALIASICKLMEANAASPIIFTGINNYLNTQFKVCEEHMSPQELDQFEKTVFPYLKRVNAKMNEVVDSAKAYYGADDPINLKVGIKFPKPVEDEDKK